MTAQLPMTAVPLPPTTPLRAASLPQQERTDHRQSIAAVVEVIMAGYWQPSESETLRSAVLRDWCDELEDWPAQSVRAALRQWREENPSKRPNPGHILGILKAAWGKRNIEAVKAALAKPEPVRDLPSSERRAEMLAEVMHLLPGMGKPSPATIVNAEIAAAASDHGVTEDEIRGYDRRPHVVAARDQAMQAASQRGIPAAEIARVMGRDHSSVLHALRKGES